MWGDVGGHMVRGKIKINEGFLPELILGGRLYNTVAEINVPY
jgi:hypothetical protein